MIWPYCALRLERGDVMAARRVTCVVRNSSCRVRESQRRDGIVRGAPQQENKHCEHCQNAERNECRLCDTARHERRDPEYGERRLLPRPEAARESMGGEEGDGRCEHHHVVVEGVGCREDRSEA